MNGVFIPDLHIGAMPIEQLKKEFKIIEDYYLKTDIDLSVIGGDFFDHKLYANSEYISFAMYAMNFILSHSKITRVVYGTRSHEWDQYTIFTELATKMNYDYKVIKFISEEEIMGMKILYVPEEYVYNKGEYYSEFLNKENEYDYVFGHGVISEVMDKAVKHSDTKSDRLKVPVFTAGELDRICKGKVYFGHYHIYTNINDKIYYGGSYSRYEFGQEKEKGFISFTYNGKKYEDNFIINTEALNYITVGFGIGDNILYDENKFYKRIQTLKENKNKYYDRLRIMVNIPDDHNNPEYIIQTLQESFKNNDNIKVVIVNSKDKKIRENTKEKIKEYMEKYSFIFDKNLTKEDITSRYLLEHDNYEISKEDVKMYITKELSYILAN